MCASNYISHAVRTLHRLLVCSPGALGLAVAGAVSMGYGAASSCPSPFFYSMEVDEGDTCSFTHRAVQRAVYSPRY